MKKWSELSLMEMIRYETVRYSVYRQTGDNFLATVAGAHAVGLNTAEVLLK